MKTGKTTTARHWMTSENPLTVNDLLDFLEGLAELGVDFSAPVVVDTKSLEFMSPDDDCDSALIHHVYVETTEERG